MTAATTTETETTTETKEAETGTEAAGGQSGEAEKDWKAEFEAQQRINRDIERRNGKRLKELETELAASKTTKAADKGEKAPEVDLDAIRQQIMAETQAATLKDKALDKIEAKAARLFKDPEDALLRLGKNVDDFIVDGKVDVDAINDALDDLIKKRPDFAITQGDAKRFQGTADAGAKGSAGKLQLTDADVKKLYREGKTDEIEAARKAGQLNTLLGIKS